MIIMNAETGIIQKLIKTDLQPEELERTIKALVLSVDVKERANIFDELISKNQDLSEEQQTLLAMAIFSNNCVASTVPINQVSNEVNDVSKLEDIIAEELHKLGIPAHIKGHNYLQEAILLSIKDQTYLEAMTTSLYPSVAQTFNTTPSRVERSIRHAIESAWTRCDSATLYQYFGKTINPYRGKATNSEFIAMISYKLRLKYKNA